MLKKTGLILIAFAGISTLILLGIVADPPLSYRMLICLFGGGFLLSSLWRLRLSQVKNRNLKQIVEERTRELTDANKNLVDEITRHHATEASLRESEKKYRLLAEHANDIIWTLSMDLNFTYVSPSIRRIRGYTPEEGMNQDLEEVLAPDSLEIATRIYA
ncbi:MAG: PAS domain S-box protein, partial [Deltaproteobacteria bacterium]